jgi:hypothetical protein
MNMRLTTLAAVLAAATQSALLAQAFSTISGSVVDQSGAPLPGVAVTVYNTERNSRQEGVTDAYGQFELHGVPQGAYRLEAELPGFERSQHTLTLNGQNVTHDFTLELGTIEEIITVVNDRNSPPPIPSEHFPPRPPNCGSSPDNDDAAGARIGGQIRQPRKIYHVPPIYPQDAPAGIVKIDAVIGTDGLVNRTTVTNDAPDILARAAVDAVQQWEFDPTLLNCQAVDVRMSVTVEFR